MHSQSSSSEIDRNYAFGKSGQKVIGKVAA